jgi:hypothetical protein
MIDPKTGGLGGFLDRLRKSGLESVADRMLGGRDTTPLTKEQLEQPVGGESSLHHLASKVGLSESALASAAGFLLPRIVGSLTPAGKVADQLSGEVQEFIRLHGASKSESELRHDPFVVGATGRQDYEASRREAYATASPREVAVSGDIAAEAHPRETYEAPRRETYEAPRRGTYEIPRRETYEAPRRETYETPRREVIHEALRRETYEAPRRETYEAPRREVVREAPRRVVEPSQEHDDSSWFWWALPLVGLALLGAYATKACTPVKEPGVYTSPIARREARSVRTVEPTQAVPAPIERRETYVAPTPPTLEPRETIPPATVEAAVAPRLVIERLDDGRVRVNGVVADDSTRQAVLTALGAAFGSGKVLAEISVDHRASAANWLARLLDIAKLVAANPRASLTLEGNKVGLGGSISDSDRRALVDSIRAYLGSKFSIE